MQLGDPTVLMETSSGEVLAAAAHDGANGGHGDEFEKINYSGGKRWPRQETLALLKIRSDMDGVFRDSSLKGPLWEEVSRKLAELGYHRSAKKCKEKFENVYKYHKRTKESRSGKSEGKTYRFFDQLQALENPFTLSNSYPPKPQPTLATTTTNTVTLLTKPSDTTVISYVTTTTVPSTNPTLVSPSPPPTNATTLTNPRNTSQGNNENNNNKINVPCNSLPNMNLFPTTSSTSSSTASDEDLEEKYRKKRKWKDYFRRLTRQVLSKQEEMQKKFLEAIDKREREHVAQQDTWRMQEMSRINREHELLVQERTTAAAKDAAVVAFLQKLSGQPLPPPPPPPVSQVQPQLLPLMLNNNNIVIQKTNNGHSSGASPMNSSSRWPKSEVHALIRMRTILEAKYDQENGPKAPLWEDISAGMQRLGYNRNAKRCKEKWENINKYFKKVKESNKKRRENSKTCPYFHELDALYKVKSKTTQNYPFGGGANSMMEPLMVQPEQQWRPPPPSQYEQHHEMKENEVQRREGEEEEDGDSMEDEGDSRYEIGTNKLSSVDTVE